MRGYDTCNIVKKISKNVYIIDLLDNMSIFKTFNVLEIYSFYDDQLFYTYLGDALRSSLL